jgi:hypothetical protein
MRHHNRARLIAVSDQGLNPRKKYVAGKGDKLVDPKSKATPELKLQEKVVVEKKETKQPAVVEIPAVVEALVPIADVKQSSIEEPAPVEKIETVAPVEPAIVVQEDNRLFKKKKSTL